MRGAIAAEWAKLRTLPAAAATMLGTVAVSGLVAGALAADGGAGGAGVVSPAAIALAVVPYMQAGAILVGVLSVAQEYAGRQIGTTLTAVPGRMRVVAAKTAAVLMALAMTAPATLAAAFGAAVLVRASAGAAITAPDATEGARLAGAALALVLIGLLAHAATLALRALVPSLSATLLLVVVLPPVLAGLSEHARWLPDRAVAGLYAPADGILSPMTGMLVALAWIGVIGMAGTARFVRRDA